MKVPKLMTIRQWNDIGVIAFNKVFDLITNLEDIIGFSSDEAFNYMWVMYGERIVSEKYTGEPNTDYSTIEKIKLNMLIRSKSLEYKYSKILETMSATTPNWLTNYNLVTTATGGSTEELIERTLEKDGTVTVTPSGSINNTKTGGHSDTTTGSISETVVNDEVVEKFTTTDDSSNYRELEKTVTTPSEKSTNYGSGLINTRTYPNGGEVETTSYNNYNTQTEYDTTDTESYNKRMSDSKASTTTGYIIHSSLAKIMEDTRKAANINILDLWVKDMMRALCLEIFIK